MSMIAYGQLSSRVWQASSAAGSSSPHMDIELCDKLDNDVRQWLQDIPPELQSKSNIQGEGRYPTSETADMLRPLLYLRGNQMRILIHRYNLFSPESIKYNTRGADIVTETAKDTIRNLHNLNCYSETFKKRHMAFNHFAVSALAVLFLAICHAPERFAATCQAEFYVALSLVKGSAAQSYAAKRLEMTIDRLKHLGPRLGLSSKSIDQLPATNTPFLSSSAVESAIQANANKAGRAGTRQDAQGIASDQPLPENTFQMNYDFMSMFDDVEWRDPEHAEGAINASMATEHQETTANGENLHLFSEGGDVSELMMNLF
jgi:hypothetical protein